MTTHVGHHIWRLILLLALAVGGLLLHASGAVPALAAGAVDTSTTNGHGYELSASLVIGMAVSPDIAGDASWRFGSLLDAGVKASVADLSRLAGSVAPKALPTPRIAGEIGPAGNPGSLRTVIGKVADLEAPGAIGSGERSLLSRLPNQGSPGANWKQNSGVLRQEMGRGVPIRDASVDPATGELVNNTGFLRAERYLLEDYGWTYDPKTHLWGTG